MAVQPTQVAPTTEPTDEQMQDMVRKDPDAVIKHYQRKFGTN
jgi:hypothetical protein